MNFNEVSKTLFVLCSFYTVLIEDEKDITKFESLYKLYRKKMFYIAKNVLHDSYEAEDAVHETFIKIAQNMNSIDDVNSKKSLAYVLTATRNVAINMLYQKSKRDAVVNIDDLQEKAIDSSLDTLCTEENYSEVLQAIQEMSPIYREVLYLTFVQELSVKEIANKLKRKSTTIYKQVERGKKLLQDSLLEKLGE